MKRRLVSMILIFGLVNIVAVLLFYGWVVAPQFSPNKLSSSRSSPEAKQESVEHMTKDFLVRSLVLKGHTLKPLRKQASRGAAVEEGLPPVPQFSKSDFIAPVDEAIVERYLRYPEVKATDTILILSPIHNVAGKLHGFHRLLQSLTYPHKLVSVAFGEDGSHDSTLHIAEDVAEELKKSFSKVDVFHLNLTGRGQVNGSWSSIHSRGNQFHRRRHLAQARNALLHAALLDAKVNNPYHYDWVLWIDSDITSLPPDIIQQLLSAERDVVVPVCAYMDNGRNRVFDKNTWRETEASLSYLRELPKNELMLEGYDDTRRLWLSDLRGEGRVVPLDGVGGCTLLVRAQCHRDGLVFPEKVFQHHIETEGLAKLAKHMGYGVYGMPFVNVFH